MAAAAVAAAAVVRRNKRPAAPDDDGEDCPAEAGEKKRSRFYHETVKEADYGSHNNSIDDDYETVEEDYEMLEDLGPSSCGGGVARARNRCTGETVAVKRVRAAIKGDGDADDGSTASLCAVIRESEAGCLAACRGHPSILQLKSVATDENTGDMFVITEPPLVGARTLRTHLTTRPSRRFSEAETRALMTQLLGAAATMHGAGVTNLDINPDNILVGPDGSSTLKICGFRCATAATTTTSEPASAAVRRVVGGEPEPPMGAMLYRSPEQLYGGIPRYGPEEDMWALGCVMAELLAGSPLFSADTEEGLLEQTIDLRDDIVTMEMEAFDGIVPELSLAGRELLAGLLDFDSWERPAAADALKHRWFTEEDVKLESLGVTHEP